MAKLKNGTYYLDRETDASGDYGPMLKSLNSKGEQVGENGELHFGCAIQCGSFFARTMQWQDWWLTTPITEFIEISQDGKYCKFKTKNSVYSVVVR